MEVRYYKEYSHCLEREMEFKVYGHRGKPVLFIPCQAGRFWDFEDFHMVDVWEKWIEEGQVTVYSCDTIDVEAVADLQGDPRHRIWLHEQWYHYIVDELVPIIHALNAKRNGYVQPIVTFGCSMGAMHAANLFFRRPDLFGGVLALSGLYDPGIYFGDYMDDLVYQNFPCCYLPNMSPDHPYIDMYNQRQIVICVGQGAWEDELKASTGWLEHILETKGIRATVDFWGLDVDHDWPWWFKQAEYYVPRFL